MTLFHDHSCPRRKETAVSAPTSQFRGLNIRSRDRPSGTSIWPVGAPHSSVVHPPSHLRQPERSDSATATKYEISDAVERVRLAPRLWFVSLGPPADPDAHERTPAVKLGTAHRVSHLPYALSMVRCHYTALHCGLMAPLHNIRIP